MLAVDLPLTREEMADYLGLTLETVSRQISRLEKGRRDHPGRQPARPDSRSWTGCWKRRATTATAGCWSDLSTRDIFEFQTEINHLIVDVNRLARIAP
jgi:hypothetical protein